MVGGREDDMNAELHRIVIGVDGSRGSWAAIREGMREARRLHLPVRLVHVVPDHLPMSPVVPVTSTVLTETGREILSLAADEAQDIAPDLETDVELRHGARAVELAASAVGARALYVGTDERAGVDRLLRGNTSTGVAARAGCPVVVVPADHDPTPRGAVVVGVKSPTHSSELLAEAFAAAEARGDRLVVLHAWKLPSGYDDIIVSRVAVEEWAERSTAEMEALLTEWRAGYPGVEVEIRVAHGDAAQELVSASASADLLVMVRRAHGVPAAMHLGGVARAVLRSAHCPVEVVPPGGVTAVPGLVVEQAGAFRA